MKAFDCGPSFEFIERTISAELDFVHVLRGNRFLAIGHFFYALERADVSKAPQLFRKSFGKFGCECELHSAILGN